MLKTVKIRIQIKFWNVTLDVIFYYYIFQFFFSFFLSISCLNTAEVRVVNINENTSEELLTTSLTSSRHFARSQDFILYIFYSYIFFLTFFFRQRQKKVYLHTLPFTHLLWLFPTNFIFTARAQVTSLVLFILFPVCVAREVQIFLVIYHHVLKHGVKNTDRSLIFSWLFISIWITIPLRLKKRKITNEYFSSLICLMVGRHKSRSFETSLKRTVMINFPSPSTTYKVVKNLASCRQSKESLESTEMYMESARTFHHHLQLKIATIKFFFCRNDCYYHYHSSNNRITFSPYTK